MLPHSQGFRKVISTPPLRNITGAHLPMGYTNYKPPLLYFGWSFRLKPLLGWAAENGIDTTMRYQASENRPVIEQPNSLSAVTQPEALAILAENAGTPHLELTFKLGIRSEDYFLLTISSNYSFLKDRKSITQDHIDTLGKYLKEHGIVQDSPGWHLDWEHYMWDRIY